MPFFFHKKLIVLFTKIIKNFTANELLALVLLGSQIFYYTSDSFSKQTAPSIILDRQTVFSLKIHQKLPSLRCKVNRFVVGCHFVRIPSTKWLVWIGLVKAARGLNASACSFSFWLYYRLVFCFCYGRFGTCWSFGSMRISRSDGGGRRMWKKSRWRKKKFQRIITKRSMYCRRECHQVRWHIVLWQRRLLLLRLFTSDLFRYFCIYILLKVRAHGSVDDFAASCKCFHPRQS